MSNLPIRPLAVGEYETTEGFRRHALHTAVCFADEGPEAGGLVAVTGPAGDEESGQYARLFAAAPDLLEALEAFLRAPSIGSDGPGSLTIVVQEFRLKDARAAIAKAKGAAD